MKKGEEAGCGLRSAKSRGVNKGVYVARGQGAGRITGPGEEKNLNKEC